MSAAEAFSLIIGAALFAYLTYALLRGEEL